MPAVVRKGDRCTGHACFPPRVNLTGSPDFIVNGKGVHRVGDTWAVHVCGLSAHGGVQQSGSSTIFANGKAVARIGDSISCGSFNAQGSPNVIFG